MVNSAWSNGEITPISNKLSTSTETILKYKHGKVSSSRPRSVLHHGTDIPRTKFSAQ